MRRIVRAFALASTTFAAPAFAWAQATPAPASAPRPAQAAPIDPARLAVATRVVDALVPQGVYVRMMSEQMPALMDGMMAEMMGKTGPEFGLPDTDGKTMGEAAKSVDPAFQERQRISTRVMYEELGKLMGEMEPAVRSGLSRSFARRFTEPQLKDMDAFFKTPSGKAFADEYLLLMMDPEMMKGMMQLAPRFIQAMPEIEKKIEAATAHLPPAPAPKDESE